MPEFYSLEGEKAILCGWVIDIKLPRMAALLLKSRLPD